MKSIIIIIIFSTVFALSCQERTVEKNTPVHNAERERMVKLNQYLLKEEVATIKAYIGRRKWKMQQTGSGLWFEILNHGDGESIKEGQKIKIKYQLELIDGTICYSSDSTGIKEVSIGKGTVESGLEEGILLMSKKGKARFILPAHLAYGMAGDGKCIPPRSSIVYHVEVLSN